MKRVGFIFEKVVSHENLALAIENSARGKKHQRRVARVVANPEPHIAEIQKLLIEKAFIPAPYVEREIHDNSAGKKRTIFKPKYYPDQIIHWALIQQIQPIIMRGMYRYCCGSIPGRGTSDGQKAVRKWLDTDPRRTKYCLKMDVRKFYPSVSNYHLKQMFRRKIKCSNTLWLIDSIIDSADGLPIGNFTSQWFSNFYLEGLDHFIKQTLGVRYYIRYVDDLVLLGPNKRKLHKARREIEQYLLDIGLQLKNDWQLFPVKSRPIDFLGMRFYRTHTTLRRRTCLRIRRRAKRIGKKKRLSPADAAAIVSYWGWVKRTNSYKFYHTHVRPHVTIQKARRVISHHARLRHHSAG